MTHLRQDEIWDADVAARYDTPGEGMFAAEVLGPTVDRLVALADGGRVLELAIGTGRVAVPLAERGVPVTGIELSAPMVARLREKADEAAIPVVMGDMATARAPGEYALVYLVFNTISNLLTQDEQVACFRNAARHLEPGGRFVIELWVPDLRRLPPDRGATVEVSRAGLPARGHLRRPAPARRLAPRPLRREPAGPSRAQPAPVRLAGRAGPDGPAGGLRAGVAARRLVGCGVHRDLGLARLGLPAGPFVSGTGETDLAVLLASMSPELHDGSYVFVVDEGRGGREEAVVVVAEAEGTTLVLPRERADELGLTYAFVASWITLRVHSALDAVGLTAAFAAALTDEGISANVVAGYFHDHLFVPEDRRDDAMRALQDLARRAAG